MPFENYNLFDESESEDDEDWFFDSVKRYKQLHMYKLSFTPTCLDVSSDKVLVAGKNQHLEPSFEMAIYGMPPKLLCTTAEQEGLTKARDFSLIAGITSQKSAFVQVQFLSNNGTILTLQEDSKVTIWSIKPQTDLIIQISSIEFANSPTKFSIFSPALFAVIAKDEFCLISIDSENKMSKLFVAQQQIVEALLIEQNKFLTIDQNRNVQFYELNTSSSGIPVSLSKTISTDKNSPKQKFCRIAAFVENDELLLASNGESSTELCYLDLKNCESSSKPLNHFEIQTSTPLDQDIFKNSTRIKNFIWSANSPALLVVESDKVHMIERPKELCTVQKLKAFSHDGHKADVLQCVLHPFMEKLFFSSDAKNCLHAWAPA